jgi:hypothetical protein
MSILNTVPGFPEGLLRLSMVLRISIGIEIEPPDMNQRHTKTYHGGGIFDEVAGLVSLALGIRCQSGGITRRWDIKTDPLGHPYEFDHKAPYLPTSDPRRPILPTATRTVALADLQPLLSVYAGTSPETATAIVRAARLYQQAVWVSESDPNLSWILLVSAIEVAAAHHATGTKPAREVIAHAWPEMDAVLDTLAPNHANEIASLVAHLVKSTRKFIDFCMQYLPNPPTERPAEWVQVDWTRMRRHLSMIYEYRSKALHSGTPFPAPLLDSPLKVEDGPPPEVPFGYSASDGASVWLKADLPMHLHIFEYLVRNALISWWRNVESAPDTDETLPHEPT